MKSVLGVLVLLIVTAVCQTPTIGDESTPANRAKEKLSPKKTVENFYQNLGADEIDKAKHFIYQPINNQRMAANLDRFLELIAKQQKKIVKVHVFDSHTLKDLSVVIFGGEGPDFTDNIDIDPMFLRQKEGEWKIVLANSASDLKQNELPNEIQRKRADELIEWYNKRKKEVRDEWRKKQK